MSIRDRGILKWNAAAFLPEQVASLKDLAKDYYSINKPILDEYQIEEYENKISDAMEDSSILKFTTWKDGYEWEYSGLVKKLDPISKMIYLELSNDEQYTMKIKFNDIVRVDVLD